MPQNDGIRTLGQAIKTHLEHSHITSYLWLQKGQAWQIKIEGLKRAVRLSHQNLWRYWELM